MSELQITEQARGNALIVGLIGDAGVTTGPQLERELTRVCAQRPGLLILDLSNLSFISSLVMGQLVAAHHAVKRAGGMMLLAATQPQVMETLMRARLQTLFSFAHSIDEALKA